MTNTAETSSTKNAALHQLGVASKKQRKALAGRVDHVRVGAGRQLVGRGSFAPTVVVAVSGSALISDGEGRVVELEAPYIIDTWAADARRVAEVTVVTTSPTSLMLIDWSERDALFGAVSGLGRISLQTSDALTQAQHAVVEHADTDASQPELVR